MKLQLLPLALCVLCTLCVTNRSLFASEKSSQYSLENTEIQELVIENTVSDSAIPNLSEVSYFSSRNLSELNIASDLENTPKNQKYSSFEEKSYNTASQIPSLSEGNNQSIFFKGLFYGFAAMVVLLNLVCFVIFEERAFLYYSFAVVGISGVMFYNDSLFEMLGFGSFINEAAMQTSLLLLAVGFSIKFASKYLNTEEFFPKLKFISYSVFGIASLMTISMWFTSKNEMVAEITSLLLYSIMTLYFLTGILLFHKKNYAKFYVIAYSIPLLFAIDYFLLAPFNINFLFTESSHLKIAATLEMLLLTYAIIYRMKVLKEENEIRQTEMKIFLNRQEMMSRQNVEKLMEDVYLENLIMHYDLDGLEIKLLQYISEGKENEKIGRKLKMTLEDVEELTKELYEKLEIKTQIEDDYSLVNSQPDYLYN